MFQGQNQEIFYYSGDLNVLEKLRDSLQVLIMVRTKTHLFRPSCTFTEKFRIVLMIAFSVFSWHYNLGQNISTIMFENKLTQILKWHKMKLDPVHSFEGSCTSCLPGTYSSSIGKLCKCISMFKSASTKGFWIEKILNVDSWQSL